MTAENENTNDAVLLASEEPMTAKSAAGILGQATSTYKTAADVADHFNLLLYPHEVMQTQLLFAIAHSLAAVSKSLETLVQQGSDNRQGSKVEPPLNKTQTKSV